MPLCEKFIAPDGSRDVRRGLFCFVGVPDGEEVRTVGKGRWYISGEAGNVAKFNDERWEFCRESTIGVECALAADLDGVGVEGGMGSDYVVAMRDLSGVRGEDVEKANQNSYKVALSRPG